MIKNDSESNIIKIVCAKCDGKNGKMECFATSGDYYTDRGYTIYTYRCESCEDYYYDFKRFNFSFNAGE